MEANPTLVNILFTVIGFLSGIGVAHFTILRKVNAMKVQIAENAKDIEFNRAQIDRTDEQVASCVEIHKEAVGLLTKIVDQNNLLIQKVVVQK